MSVADPTRRQFAVVVGVAVAILIVADIVALIQNDEAERSTTTASSYVSAAVGLCDAERAADSGDAAAAKTAFFNTAHQPLHDLARRLEDGHRKVAGRLLIAKEAVEADLADANAARAAEHLARLLEVTHEAVTMVEGTRLASCSTKGPRQ